LIGLLPAYAQPKLVLENIRTGRQKEIERGDRIKITFTTRYEGAKVYHIGKLLSATDSTVAYALPFLRDTVTVALASVSRIGKHNGVGSLLLLAGISMAGGVTLVALESNTEKNVQPLTSLLVLGATLWAYNGLDALVYPRRKVNQTGAKWRLRTIK